MAVVCVDAGTTLIKAVGYVDGVETVVVRGTTAVSRPRPGWAEQDMGEVWASVASCVREAVGRLAEPVEFLAITAQGDGCWLVDRSGAPTGPAILWNDSRAASIVADWSRAGVLDEAFRRNGSMTFAGLPNALLTWLRAHEPERLKRSSSALTCGGWIFAQLTGVIGVDSSDGSAPFMDLATGRLSLFNLYGMPWASGLVPDLLEDRVAPLRAEGLGLPAGTPVVMAPYDIAATAIGVGAVKPGQACTILGTTLCTEVVTAHPLSGGPAAGLTVALGLPGLYLRAFPTLAGGEIIQWAGAMLGLDGPLQLGALAMGAEKGAGGLTFLPYLSPAGERAPFLDPLARGSFHGLTVDHGRAELARAVLEGLSLVVRDCLAASGAHPSSLAVCGGGAANDVWVRMIADVTGVPVSRSADAEAGARGAYVVGALATGSEPVAGRVGAVFEPSGGYDGLYERFLKVRSAVSATWELL